MPEFFKTIDVAAEVANEGSRTMVIVVSNGAIDRDNEVVLPKGANLKEYAKNPVVLWAHDYASKPIARALWTRYDKDRDAIVSKWQFADTAEAMDVFRLYQGGFLNAASIGVGQPAESRQPTPAEKKANPAMESVYRVWAKWTLLEVSAVPIPANPEALALAVSKGLKLPASMQVAEQPEPASDAAAVVAPPVLPAAAASRRVIVVEDVRVVEEVRKTVRRVICTAPAALDIVTENDIVQMTNEAIARLRGRIM